MPVFERKLSGRLLAKSHRYIHSLTLSLFSHYYSISHGTYYIWVSIYSTSSSHKNPARFTRLTWSNRSSPNPTCLKSCTNSSHKLGGPQLGKMKTPAVYSAAKYRGLILLLLSHTNWQLRSFGQADSLLLKRVNFLLLSFTFWQLVMSRYFKLNSMLCKKYKVKLTYRTPGLSGQGWHNRSEHFLADFCNLIVVENNLKPRCVICLACPKTESNQDCVNSQYLLKIARGFLLWKIVMKILMIHVKKLIAT